MAQLELSTIVTDENIIENFIVEDLFGCNTSVSNVNFTGNPESIGMFNYIQNDNLCSGEFGLDRGILMTTGMINHALGPNNSGDSGQEWNVEYDNSFLHNYLVEHSVITPSVSLYDACVLEFDISPESFATFDFEVIFGSEEYTEWMSPYYADAFCFFVSEIDGDVDPNFDANPTNIMETGNVLNANCDITNKPISAWTVRPYSQMLNMPGMNECLYLDNQNGTFCDEIGYDGYTIPMLFNLSLYPGANYRIKIVILDGVSGGFSGLDSGVFIQKSNLTNNNQIDFTWVEPEYSSLGATVAFSNISSVTTNNTYLWDFNSDGEIDSEDPNPIYIFENTGSYNVTLQVIDNCTGLSNSVSYDVVINDAFDITSVSDNSYSDILIYPNPSSDYLIISFDNLDVYDSVVLTNISGKVIYKANIENTIHNISIHHYPSGLYYLRIINSQAESSYFKKVLIL